MNVSVIDIPVAVINASTMVTDDEVQSAMQALQTQVSKHFAPAWGINAELKFCSSETTPPQDSWWLVILDNTDQAAELGYYDLTSQGLPLGKVFAAIDKQEGYQWTVTASHVLLETLADPGINLAACVQRSANEMVFYAYDICDPCQSEDYSYTIGNIRVSNFVLPTWFEPFQHTSQVKFDHENKIRKPFGLLPDGYICVLDARSGTGWHQLIAEGDTQRYDRRPRPGTRRERRLTPRDQWLPSHVKVPMLAGAR